MGGTGGNGRDSSGMCLEIEGVLLGAQYADAGLQPGAVCFPEAGQHESVLDDLRVSWQVWEGQWATAGFVLGCV